MHIEAKTVDDSRVETVHLVRMGAAWVTMKKSTALLLPGFKFQEIKGAIDPRKISIKLDDERNQVIYYLSELRDALQEEFGLNSITEAEWMHSCHDLLQGIIDGK